MWSNLFLKRMSKAFFGSWETHLIRWTYAKTCWKSLWHSEHWDKGFSSHLITEYQRKYLVPCYCPRYLRFKCKNLNSNHHIFNDCCSEIFLLKYKSSQMDVLYLIKIRTKTKLFFCPYRISCYRIRNFKKNKYSVEN